MKKPLSVILDLEEWPIVIASLSMALNHLRPVAERSSEVCAVCDRIVEVSRDIHDQLGIEP